MRFVLLVLVTFSLCSCIDYDAKAKEESTNCYHINDVDDYAPILVDGCKGDTWILVKTSDRFVKDGNFVYRWFPILKEHNEAQLIEN